MNSFFAVACGGAVGTLMRYCVIGFFNEFFGMTFPYGTFFVNIVGSFLIGCIAEAVSQNWSLSSIAQLFLMTGVLGGFTTFSAFSLDIFKLTQEGQSLIAIGYAFLSVAGAFAALMTGVLIVRGIMS